METQLQNKPATNRKEIHASQKISILYSWSVPTLKQWSSKLLHALTNSCMNFYWCFVELPTFASKAEGRCIPTPDSSMYRPFLISTAMNMLIACQGIKKRFADSTPRKCTATKPQRLFPGNVFFFPSSTILTLLLSSHPALGSFRLPGNRKLSFSVWINLKERR